MRYYEILTDKIMMSPCCNEVILKRFLDGNNWRLPYDSEAKILSNRMNTVFTFHSLKRGENLVDYFKEWDTFPKLKKIIHGLVVLPIVQISKQEYDSVCSSNTENRKMDYYNDFPGRCVFTSGPDGFDRTNFGRIRDSVAELRKSVKL